MNKRFNSKKLEKLNNPERLEMIPPAYIWNVIAPVHHTDKVEIGAGTGLFSREFQKISGRGKTFALDISEDMISWMKENIIEDFPSIIPMKTDGKVLPLADNLADIIYTITMHHEVGDPGEMLCEARRILRKEGRIFIADWNMNRMDSGPPAEIRCTAEEVASQLDEAGFPDVRIDPGFDNFFLVTARG